MIVCMGGRTRSGHDGGGWVARRPFPARGIGPNSLTCIDERDSDAPCLSACLAIMSRCCWAAFRPSARSRWSPARPCRRGAGAARRAGDAHRRRPRTWPRCSPGRARMWSSTPCTAPGARTAVSGGLRDAGAALHPLRGAGLGSGHGQGQVQGGDGRAGVTVPGGGLFDRFEAARPT